LKKLKKVLDKSIKMWYNKDTNREKLTESQFFKLKRLAKKKLKKLKKRLDKSLNLWYNKNVVRERAADLKQATY
jgi:hypothetical protein